MTESTGEKIILTCIEKDKAVRIYEINYKGQIFRLQFYLKIENNVLYMDSVDVEGAGANIFGTKMKTMISEVSYEFCKKYKTSHISITGNRRSAGRTKGKFLKSIKLSFDTIV
jgi:hypothetical protein